MPSIPTLAADFQTQLSGAVSAGATTATLVSATDDDDVALPNGEIYLTIDGSSPQKEYIKATLTGVALTSIVNISRQGAETAGFEYAHRTGAKVTITDWAVLSRIKDILNGESLLDADGTVAYDAQPVLSDPNALATVQYVLDTSNGGPVSINAQVITGDAGENVADGDWVYLNTADGEWYKTDADDIAKSVNIARIGKARGAGTNGNAITGGIFVSGTETVGTYTPGQAYYLSNTAGALATSAGTNSVIIGYGDANGDLLLRGATPNGLTFLGGVTGMVLPFAGSSVPDGFLTCDGSAVSRTTYAGLFAVISTTWGVGDGSTTFNLPDLRGRSIIGAGIGTKVATFASRSSNVVTVTGLTNAANNEFQTGQLVNYVTTGTPITGLTTATNYYLVRTGNLTFSLATSLANAQNGTVISLSGDGSGTQTFTLTLTARTAGQTGGEENHAMSSTELLSHTHVLKENSGSGDYPQAFSSTPGGNGSVTTPLGFNESTGGNAAMNNMQPFGVISYIIKH